MTIDELIRSTPDASDADVLANYQVQPATFRRVPIDEVNFYLIDRFLNGRLRLARDNTQMPTPVRAFLGDFLINIQLAKSLDGTSETIRSAIGQVLPVLVQAGVMTQDESDGFQAMLIDVDPAKATLGEVTAARVRLTRTALISQWADVHNAIAAGIDDGTLTDFAAIKAKAVEVMA